MLSLISALNVTSFSNDSALLNTLSCTDGYNNISCVNACSNVQEIFHNWPNFYTCSFYPAIVTTLNASLLLGQDISSIPSLETKGIFRNDSALSSNISITIANCLADYCKWSSDCRSLDWSNSCDLSRLLESNNAFSQILNRKVAEDCLKYGVCGSTSDVNPDIGGLGVIISVLIQYIISIFGVAAHAGFTLRHQTFMKRQNTKTDGQENIEDVFSRAEKRLDHHLQTLTSALVEFQKAQCFFSTAIQIAALTVLPRFSHQSRAKDEILLKLSSANAFTPITLTLAHIDFLGGRDSWYLFGLSSISFILGTLAYWLSTGTIYNGYYSYASPLVPVSSCGNVAPVAPCFVRNEYHLQGTWPHSGPQIFSPPAQTQTAIWILSLLIMIYRLFTRLARCERLKDRCRSLQTKIRMLSDWFSKLKNNLLPIIFFGGTSSNYAVFACFPQWLGDYTSNRETWDCIQLVLGGIAAISQLASIILVLVSSLNIIETTMSFGQIVAVGIWVPVLLEYVYLVINGAAVGTEYRLMNTLVVSKSPIAILGDATHASTPHQGAGAGQAIEDALILGRLLSHPKTQSVSDIPAAFEAYDTVRRPRS